MHLTLQYGSTALMKASEAGQVESVKMLLDRGAEVNMQNKVNSVIVHAIQHVCSVPSSE